MWGIALRFKDTEAGTTGTDAFIGGILWMHFVYCLQSYGITIRLIHKILDFLCENMENKNINQI